MAKRPDPIHWFWLFPAAAFGIGLWREHGAWLALGSVAGGLLLGVIVRYRAARRSN